MNSIKLGEWEMWIEDGSLPSIFGSYLDHAEFVDQIDLNNSEGRFLFLGFSKGNNANGWPPVIVAQKYQDSQRTFSPGVLLIPDTSLAFVGAGERLLCYNIEEQRRLWEDETDYGFFAWYQSGPYVLMSAELEFGVWDQFGKKLWSTFVEPPWDFKVRGQFVELTVMGDCSIYRLSDGLRQV
ncbi:hypothetical protein FIV06_03005 [Labrenzia sp. THAF191b]|uniref:hypothetical protein n=1 Tax=unclassified Labrenzia TaxID=2648686 RepID=UPI0012697F3B|nr:MULTISPECIES: hypothetical protein [unclassified Labrenzia]QFS96372.1 hypothetical protein FIV06_03005 [Labrenzia sp. THAF191b]QFT02687.1 hypothetical protein FIV05_03005 [Labrenzia sp. THAF191a]QFT14229.1 hypothetical protein FIV03_03010 [Labrenzia sp. THAF187b]